VFPNGTRKKGCRSDRMPRTRSIAERKAAQNVKSFTNGDCVNTAIEALGVPATFLLCRQIFRAGDVIANVGVDSREVDPHLAMV
jgi:alcohol dehydrogenase